MIDADIVYVRAESAEDAVAAWAEFAARGGIGADAVRYLGGSTEIVTGARKAGPTPAVLVDVKRVAEARVLGKENGRIAVGAATPLNAAGDSRLFPLLSAAIRRIADRTTRNRLSVGGNVAGALPYREAALPLLLADATVLTIKPVPGSPPVRSERPLRSLFEKRLKLEPGELILSFSVAADAAELPWKHYRATRTAAVDYPLVTACFLRRNGGPGVAAVAAAVSGLHPYPVLFDTVEALASSLTRPTGARSDQRAAAAYRVALAEDMIRRAGEELA